MEAEKKTKDVQKYLVPQDKSILSMCESVNVFVFV